MGKHGRVTSKDLQSIQNRLLDLRVKIERRKTFTEEYRDVFKLKNVNKNLRIYKNALKSIDYIVQLTVADM